MPLRQLVKRFFDFWHFLVRVSAASAEDAYAGLNGCNGSRQQKVAVQ
jgi:hypothetical protein